MSEFATQIIDQIVSGETAYGTIGRMNGNDLVEMLDALHTHFFDNPQHTNRNVCLMVLEGALASARHWNLSDDEEEEVVNE